MKQVLLFSGHTWKSGPEDDFGSSCIHPKRIQNWRILKGSYLHWRESWTLQVEWPLPCCTGKQARYMSRGPGVERGGCPERKNERGWKFSFFRVCLSFLTQNWKIAISQDSLVGSALDWYLEGPGFKSHHLQFNFQLEKGCRRVCSMP